MAVCLKLLLPASDVWATHVMPCSSVDAIGNGDMKTIMGGREGDEETEEGGREVRRQREGGEETEGGREGGREGGGEVGRRERGMEDRKGQNGKIHVWTAINTHHTLNSLSFETKCLFKGSKYPFSKSVQKLILNISTPSLALK